jgi:hypothetical protein
VGEESGALNVNPTSLPQARRGVVAAVWLLTAVPPALLTPAAAAGHVPPDTIRVDTLKVDTIPRADTLRKELADPEMEVRDDARAPGDSLPADTIFHNLPRVDVPGPAGWAQGVWHWDQEAIMVSGAVSLADLLAEVPGVITLRAGDFGTPLAATAFGLGGGGIRVFRDGFEVLPLEGGVPDLARIGLVGISSVRVERFPGSLNVRLEGFQHTEGRAFSVVEAGTGDLATNLLRGIFADPTSLGGSVGVGLERADSRGARGNETGDVTGTWLRYQLHRGDAAGLAVELRKMGSKTEAADYASSVSRTDWTVRGRVRVVEGLSVEAYGGKSTHRVDDVRPAFALEGGARSQLGVRAALERSGVFAEGAYRRFGGAGLPSGRLDARVGADLPAVGGVSAELDRAFWPDVTTGARRVRGWTHPVLGLSVFGSWESGTAGARLSPLMGSPEPDAAADAGDPPEGGDVEGAPGDFHVTERTATRLGAQWAWRGFALSGALLELEVDSLLPLGLQPDRGAPALPGGTRSGWEVWGRIPMPLRGLAFQGSLQQWEEDWSYLPRRRYSAALVFHDTFLESGNLEWWWTLGVRGHDPMTVRQVAAEGEDGVELAVVPFFQDWYAQLQLRILTFKLFVGWENFARRPALQSYPGRLLPVTRAVYGIRWTLWN